MVASSSPPHVVIIGGGAGGLSAALVLRARGYAVTIVEKQRAVGGKLCVERVRDKEVDAGPTVLTLPWTIESLFKVSGVDLHEYIEVERAKIIARHAWPDGSSLDLYADPAETTEAIRAFAGAAETDRYVAFAREIRAVYDAFELPFIRSQRPTLGSLVTHATRVGFRSFSRADAHRSLWSSVSTRLRDPRLIQLFARYATYVGGSPFETPATLSLIAHVEALGVHRVRGGMVRLARALERRAQEVGVELLVAREATEILTESGSAAGVRSSDGSVIRADAVVSNVDVAALGQGLLGHEARRAVKSPRSKDRSLSAVTIAMVAKPTGFPLVHHNVFFSPDYRAEFQDLMGHSRVPDEPTVYLCAQDRSDAPRDGHEERLFLIVNAPPTGDEPGRWQRKERERCETAILRYLTRFGLTLRPEALTVTTPVEWANRFPGTGGAIYGERPRGVLSPLSKPASRSRLPRLYLTGGSVHPGPGVPMAIQSGFFAADAISEDFRWTVPSRMEATSGITSMP